MCCGAAYKSNLKPRSRLTFTLVAIWTIFLKIGLAWFLLWFSSCPATVWPRIKPDSEWAWWGSAFRLISCLMWKRTNANVFFPSCGQKDILVLIKNYTFLFFLFSEISKNNWKIIPTTYPRSKRCWTMKQDIKTKHCSVKACCTYVQYRPHLSHISTEELHSLCCINEVWLNCSGGLQRDTSGMWTFCSFNIFAIFITLFLCSV